MTADANVEFAAFDAYAEWCKGQAHDDGHQQEILAPSPAVYATLAPVVEYIAPAPAVFYAARAQVVEYLAPAPFSLWPHLSRLQQLASVLSLWSPSSSMMTLVASCERHVHLATIDVGASIASTNAAIVNFTAKAESAASKKRRISQI